MVAISNYFTLSKAITSQEVFNICDQYYKKPT